MSKLKIFADDNFSMAQLAHFFSLMGVESIGGKGKKIWLPVFSPFPSMASFQGSLKKDDFAVKG